MNNIIQSYYKRIAEKFKLYFHRRWHNIYGTDVIWIAPCCALSQSCPVFAYREAFASLLCEYWADHESLQPRLRERIAVIRIMTLTS